MNEVKEQYEHIAKAFSQTRKKALWPELINYVTRLKPGDRILDMGAGSGRLCRALPSHIEYIGVDISPAMLKEARRDHPKAQFFEADILDNKALERFGQFDYIFVIALAHHLEQKQLQQLFTIIKQKLKPDGFVFLSCWRLYSKKFLLKHLSQIFTKIKSKNLRIINIPFSYSNGSHVYKTIERTCYAYDLFTLKKTAKKCGFQVLEAKKNGANLWLELKICSNNFS